MGALNWVHALHEIKLTGGRPGDFDCDLYTKVFKVAIIKSDLDASRLEASPDIHSHIYVSVYTYT